VAAAQTYAEIVAIVLTGFAMPTSTPIAFLIFNRPEPTAQVFAAIAAAQPTKLLVVADGPRHAQEADLCTQTRSLVQQVDWDCEVLTNFAEHNLGCKNRVSSGLNWIFSQVEEAIILEDDCLPDPSFFSFCTALLDRYRHDPRVMHISGSNFQFGQSRTPYSYYASRYGSIWGWATWRRAWQHYDVNLKTWQIARQDGVLNHLFDDPAEANYWISELDRVLDGTIDTWDYQWTAACWLNQGLAIVPDRNLISNIGFGQSATHTHRRYSTLADLPRQPINEIKHPPYLIRHAEADAYTFDHAFGGVDRRPLPRHMLVMEIDRLHADYSQTMLALKRAELERDRTQLALQETQAELNAIKSSKFWQLRMRWIRLKAKLLGTLNAA